MKVYHKIVCPSLGIWGLLERRRNRIYETLCYSDWKQDADTRTSKVSRDETKKTHKHTQIRPYTQPAKRGEFRLASET
jgi:hypothetical protein